MCGLFGQINGNIARHFDYRTFCTLGIVNDSRGGDSCGVFIDGEADYGIGNDKYFASFMNKSVLIDKTNKCKIAFGHCRKTSVGITSLETAQPVVIKENDKIVFVVMHNGTIHNYEDLAKKYIPDVDIKGMSDSQIMANIFYQKGFDVLTEYNGAAVFVIADYRNNENDPDIFMFKGASKNSNSVVIEERPIWVTKSKSGSIFFSSIGNILFPINKNEDVYTLEQNWLYQIKNQDFYKIKEYNRSECFQTKQYNTASNTVTLYSKNYEKDYNEYYEGYVNQYSSSGYYDNNKESKYLLPKPYDTFDITLEDSAYIISFKKWDRLNIRDDLRYFIENDRSKILHGGFYITDLAYVTDENASFAKIRWFWDGVMLKNKTCFEYLLNLQSEFKVTIGEVSEGYSDLLCYFSVLPTAKLDGIYYKTDSFMDNRLIRYTGKVNFPYTRTRIEVEDGIVKYRNIGSLKPYEFEENEEWDKYNPNEDVKVTESV